MRRKSGNVAKRHLTDLSVPHFSLYADQSSRGLELQPGYRLGCGDHPGFDQHGDDTDRIAARHRRIFDLLHDHEPGVGFRVGGGQYQVAIRGRISTRFPKHAQPDMIGVRLKVDFLLEHRRARNVEHATGDHAARFSARMGVYGCDHTGESHFRKRF